MKFKYNFILITILCLFIQSTKSDIVDLTNCLVFLVGLLFNSLSANRKKYFQNLIYF